MNCGGTIENLTGANFGEDLKAMIKRWKADGLDLETGKVNYLRLAKSEVFSEFSRLSPALCKFDPSVLATRDKRQAFWINIYNVLAIHGLAAYEEDDCIQEIHGTFERMAYFIGDLRCSLADIEHGVLRSNRAHHGIRRSHKTNHIVPSVRFSKRDSRIRHVLQEHDPRIHFAIVCGSNSCPPVGIYQSNVLDEQLNLAAKNFLNNDAVTLN